MTVSAGLDNLSGTYAVSWGDYNNDGYPDLFVTISSSTGTLFLNNGNGTFSTGPNIGSGGRAAAWSDYDNDGDLDLLRAINGFLYQNNGNGTFTLLNGASIGFPGLTNLGSFGWLDYDEDGYLDIWTPDGTSPGNHIYKNDGDGTFTDQGADALGLTPSSNGETTVVTDFDGDGSTDILYRGTSVVLWHSNGNGTFTNITGSAGISLTGTSGGYNGTAFGDYDSDGDLDCYGAQGGTNKLYRNNGDLTFTDVASSAGVQAGSSTSRGVAWGDYDNDGDLDLYVAHSDAANHLFRNNGDGTFTDVAPSLGLDDGGAGYGVTFADYDLDGDLDIFLANNSGASKLYRNDLNNGNYLKVKVMGSGSGGAPADGAGTRVELWNAGNTLLLATREITGGEGYDSQRPHIVHFGVTPGQAYVVKAKLTSGITITRGGVVPQSESITVGATTLNNTINIVEGAGASILESGGSTDVNEAGATSDTYTIALNVAPTANVTITVDPDTQTDLGAGAGTAVNLTFTTGNWSVAQTVTVTAINDLIAEGAHASTITHSASSSDGNYNGVSIANVTANVTDNDTAGVTITQSGGSTDISENGPTSDTYTVVLDTEPTASVTIAVDPDVDSDVGGGAGTAINFTFTTGNWSAAQTVTVTAVDDGFVEGAHSSTITHIAASGDSFYNAISISSTTANVTDNDVASVIVAESGGSTDVNEAGPTSDTYTLVLDAQPTADVALSVDPDPQVSVGVGAGNSITLTFTAANWNTPQTVTVTAYDDAVYESSHTATIAHSTTSSDANFHGLSIASITANVSDNDSPPPSGGGGGASSNDPVAPNQILIIGEDDTIEITLTASGPQGGTPTFYLVTLPQYGSLLGDPPTLEYIPESNYSGTDHFLYLVVNTNGTSNLGVITIDVQSAPDPPVASSAEISVDQDSRGNALNLTAADPDAGDAVTITIISLPFQGTLSVGGVPVGEDDIPLTLETGDSIVVYNPEPGFVGTDWFKWIANDGTTDSETATLTIQIAGKTSSPFAFDVVLSIVANDLAVPLPLTMALPGSMSDWDVVILSLPLNGTLLDDVARTIIDAGDLPYRLHTESPILYTPNLDFVGMDLINWSVSNSTEEGNTATVLFVVNPAERQSPDTESLHVEGEQLDAPADAPRMCGAFDNLGILPLLVSGAGLRFIRQNRKRRRRACARRTH